MSLAKQTFVAATNPIFIKPYVNSTGVVRLHYPAPLSQFTNAQEISQSYGTGGSLTVLGIPVVIEIDENSIVVTDYILHMYGVGNSVKAAIEDYKTAVKSYFEELQENEDKLGSKLKQHLIYLRGIFIY